MLDKKLLKRELELDRRSVINMLKATIDDPETFRNPQILAKSILNHIYNIEYEKGD